MPTRERQTVKEERLEVRVSAATKELCQEAAAIEGRSLTDFIVGSVTETAKRIIRENRFLDLSLRDRQAFVNALINPPSPSVRLQKAVERYKRIFGE